MPALLRRRFTSFLLTVAAGSCGVASAQVPPSLEGIVRPLMETHRVPGVGIAVIKDRVIAWTASFGVNDMRASQSVDAQTLFQAASISKVVTGLTVLRLVDRGRFDLVIEPVGMPRSSFVQPLGAAETNAASAHDPQGKALAGHGHVYPELAAAGLWTTPSDLARLALAMAESWRSGGLLGRPLAREAATPVGNGPTGLGIFVAPRAGGAPWLYHYGVNAGFRSVLVFAADGSYGLVLMTNGEGGRALIPAVIDALLKADGQSAFTPPEG